ncbi:MAG: hypothetical protein K5776_03970 [Lachnospiraceae bacterium]|nr:hypothetical protein [Lachnospiraceae bacterium]
MGYLIAVGSSDEINVNLKFGEADEVLIYEVEGTDYSLKEKRKLNKEAKPQEAGSDNACSSDSCRSCSCSGSGQGCNGGSDAEEKVRLMADCRCVLFKKVGFQAQKQFEKKAISIFDIECEISDAFEKITKYYEKVDSHSSLRNR